MTDQAASLQRLLELSEDDLYLEIGTHLHGKSAFPVPPKQLIEQAKRWSQEKLADAVCKSDKLKAIARQDVATQDLVLSVCGVLDIVSHLLGSVPAVTAAALVVRVGLHKFCATIWNHRSDIKGPSSPA